MDMDWISLSSNEQLQDIKTASFEKPQVILKHSTRCSISSVVFNRLKKEADHDVINFYVLDLLKNRTVSNTISEVFDVNHESPQVLLIENGECIYHESHYGINMDEIFEKSSFL